MLTISLEEQHPTGHEHQVFKGAICWCDRNSLFLVLLGLPALGSADLLLVVIDLLSALGSLGLVVSPGDLGTVGVVELEIRGQLAGRGLVPSSGRTALVYELERVGRKGINQKGMKQSSYERGGSSLQAGKSR